MKNYNLLHLGIGNIGTELVNQILKAGEHIEKKYGVKFTYCGLYTSSCGIFNKNGLDTQKELLNIKNRNTKNEISIDQAITECNTPFILIDTTNSNNNYQNIKLTLQKGGYAVLSNKKPLTGSQKEFDLLMELGKQKLFFETVVGAGLPVIQTIQTLIDTGDEILEIQGCLSGTLGFIFSELERGAKFSESVISAIKIGFSERDPREDLSGRDVARKALILTRLTGKKLELADVNLTELFPQKMQSLSPDEFLKQLPELDQEYREQVEKAKKENCALRYVAKINKDECSIGLETVSIDSDLGRLKGSDNMIVIKTKRYYKNPMVIKGPGAGIAVTAAGVLGDLINIIKSN